MKKRLALQIFSVAFLSAIFFARFSAEIQAQEQEQQKEQKLVESVDVEGNRRNRTDDILYFIQTRQGDTYSQKQVEADLKRILDLGFFDKTETKVLTQPGPRDGINIIFHVKELPVIRDIQFEGLKSVQESDVLKAFRENRIGVSKEAVFDPVKVRNATRVIKELLSARGHPNATIENRREEVSSSSLALTFVVDEGERVRVDEINFTGNEHFKDSQLRNAMKFVKETGLIPRFKSTDILDREKLEHDLFLVGNFMRSKGYLQARTSEPKIESLGEKTTGFFIPLPFISSKDEALRVTIPVVEGRVYKIGEIKVEGNSIYSEEIIKRVIGLNNGDIADGAKISKALYENLKALYGQAGFIQYTAEPEPTFKDDPQNPNEGIVDFKINIEEGKQFTLRRLEFAGNTFTRDYVLRRAVLINEGDVYDQRTFEYSVLSLNQLGYFNPIDKEKDVDMRTDEDQGLVDVTLRVSERGKQEISFNGGVSGDTGSFFGLTYSTNNLLGRGETLSFSASVGNQQNSFVFSFTEPYFRNRPITVGFSLFTSSLKFFGSGTQLSQNVDALTGLLTGTTEAFLATDPDNLFTQNQTGGSIFLSAPLSEFYKKRRFTQFSRVGLSYTLSQSSVEDPEVNQQNDPNTFIPVLFRQPNIITSQVTPTFVYNTTNGGIDPTRGINFSAGLAFAGLGGDVRTYQPSLTYTQYIPVRNKKSENPHVFAFRILASTISSYSTTDKVLNANSLAFIDGTPIYSRFFLGDENSIRGYDVRSISPVAPVETFITSSNVVVASNSTGTPQPVAGLESLASIGVFTGAEGSNPLLFSRTVTAIGGDTQLLANFEYRFPIFGPLTAAAYVDIGSSFNRQSGEDQFFNTEFVADEPFLRTNGSLITPDAIISSVTLTSLAVIQNPELAITHPVNDLGAVGLVVQNNQFVTQTALSAAIAATPVDQLDPNTGLPPGFQQVFLRGDAQTNTAVRLSQSIFSGIGNFRSSVGLEFRIQVPVINIPFRLIYYYNPNARRGEYEGVFFDEPKSGFRFSIGRTF